MSCYKFQENCSLLLLLLFLLLNGNQFNLKSCSFLGYLKKRMIVCLWLEVFNCTNLHLPFFKRFLGVITCGTKSYWLSLSSLSLPLSVTKCCRFFLKILPADSFFCFHFDDLGCLSTERAIKNLLYSKLYSQLDIKQITEEPFLGKCIGVLEKIGEPMTILLKRYI